MKRWFIIGALLFGTGVQTEAAELIQKLTIDSMARFAIGTDSLSRIVIPLQPKITGAVNRLDVVQKHRISKHKSAYEMRCFPAGSCAFPFFAIVEKPEIREMSPEYILGKGDVVTLRMIRRGYSAQMVGVCMERGGINDQIRVKSLDGKQKFSATVIDRELVISETWDHQ